MHDDDSVIRILMGVLATGFAVWAGALWRASVWARSLSTKVSELDTGLIARIERLEARMTEHELLRQHHGAADDMMTTFREIQELRREVHDINPERT